MSSFGGTFGLGCARLRMNLVSRKTICSRKNRFEQMVFVTHRFIPYDFASVDLGHLFKIH
jgi:hypothetical protein